MYVSIRSGAHARRITQRQTLPSKREIEGELPIVRGRVPAESDQPAACTRSEIFNLQTILIENQRPIDLAKRARQINVGNRAVLNLNLTLHYWLRRIAGYVHIHCDQARRSKVWIEALNQSEIDAPLRPQAQLAFTGQSHGAARGQIRSFTNQMKLINFQ